MGDRPRRNIVPINYKIYHNTGKMAEKSMPEFDPIDKLTKSLSEVNIGMADKLKRNSRILSKRIVEFQVAKDLENFDEVIEVKEFISEATLLKQELIEIDTDLEISLSENEYENFHKKYIQELELLRNCIKQATNLKKSLERKTRKEEKG